MPRETDVPHGCPIAIAQQITGTNHFTGVDEALRAAGAEATWLPLEERPHLGAGTRVVAVSDVRAFEALHVLRQARRAGACSVLLMDGICEYRNTFLNPLVGADFLRPAPVDVIACAGRADADRLRELGNDAVPTGLPRLAAITPAPRPGARAVMVATARRPAVSDEERVRLVACLRAVRDRLEALGVQARWRLTGGLDLDLGVRPDPAPLLESLAAVDAVLTTPSTLLIEAMRAGRPVAILHPFDAPCWPQAAWLLDGGAAEDPGALDATIRSLLEPSSGDWRRQARALAAMHREDAPPADAVAGLLLELADRPRRRRHPAHLLDPTRLPDRVRSRRGRRRVVSMVHCDTSPVGGVTTWSERLAGAFAAEPLGYDVRTLLIATHPDSVPHAGAGDEHTSVCVVDPGADQWEAVGTVRAALERLEPSIVLPNYADLCYAASMQLRWQGARTVAVAHTDHESVRHLMRFYDRWDGAAGVSRACMDWLAPIAAGRPVAAIVYGVPIAGSPRAVPPAGPLSVAYVGRMVEPQKRISDLLLLIDGLESRRVEYEFHVVGDGAHLESWRRSLSERRLRHGLVRLHGRRSAAWVERFLATVDVTVLVSDYEGTSIAMLESMGAGVVPAVTRVSSGVDEWISHGETGIVVPIGDPDAMAGHLAEMAVDRSRIAAMGRAAWETVRGRIGIDLMARRYRDLFDAVMDRPMDRAPSDAGLRLCERYTWRKEWVERPDEAMRWIEAGLREAGYRAIALDTPTAGCDAVIVRAGGAEPVEERVAALRRAGLGVAVWPHLIENPVSDRMHRAAKGLLDKGCRRLAIYGIGAHTRRSAEILDRGLPFVGFIDDGPLAWRRIFGLPVVSVDRALQELDPDAVLLSSDAWEEQLWRRCAPLRRAGVRVASLYGTYPD